MWQIFSNFYTKDLLSPKNIEHGVPNANNFYEFCILFILFFHEYNLRQATAQVLPYLRTDT